MCDASPTTTTDDDDVDRTSSQTLIMMRPWPITIGMDQDDDNDVDNLDEHSCHMQPLVPREHGTSGLVPLVSTLQHANTTTSSSSTCSRQSRTTANCDLPLQLRLLFALMGASLALPTTALLYLVNTRVELPLSLLPAYGALCFVPYSLKPLYAVVTQQLEKTYVEKSLRLLLPVLLLLHAVALIATMLVVSTTTHVTSLFVAGICRGVTNAWPEFLLELVLVRRLDKATAMAATDHKEAAARVSNSRSTLVYDDDAAADAETPAAVINDAADSTRILSSSYNSHRTGVAAILQSQAATARNFGSWAGHILATLSLLLLSLTTSAGTSSSAAAANASMNQSMAAWLLGLTALLNILGSVYGWHQQVGLPERTWECETTTVCDDHGSTLLVQSVFDVQAAEDVDGDVHCIQNDLQGNATASQSTPTTTWFSKMEAHWFGSSSSSSSKMSKIMVGLLQICVIVLVLQGPISTSSMSWLWYLAIIVAGLILLAFLLVMMLFEVPATFQVGCFLILRHAMPTASYLMASFVYELFESAPVVLQLLSVLNMGVMTLASWSFGIVFGYHADNGSKHNPSDNHLYHLMIKTTLLAAAVSLVGQLVLTGVIPSVPSVMLRFLAVFVVQSLGTVAGEWKFLPDVILATVTTSASSSKYEASVVDLGGANRKGSDCNAGDRATATSHGTLEGNNADASGVQYGSLISCIDFGGQLNAILIGLLVNALNVNRENDWNNLDRLIEIGALATFLSIGLVVMILRPKTR